MYGIEIDNKSAEEARSLGVSCIQLDIDEESFPFEDNFFDAVFAGSVIEFLLHPDRLLQESHRVLKPEGHLLLTTPNLASWHTRLLLLLGYQPYSLPVKLPRQEETALGQFLHPRRDLRKMNEYLNPSGGGGKTSRLFTLRAIKEALELYGFQISQLPGAPDIALFGIPWPLSTLVSLMENTTSHFASLASYIIVEAVKPSKSG